MFQNITQIVKKSFNGPKQRTMALHWSKKLSALLKGIIAKQKGDFYCLNCLHSFTTKSNREFYKRVCQNKGFCNIIMPSEDTKILEFNQYQKSVKSPFSIYADLGCLIG